MRRRCERANNRATCDPAYRTMLRLWFSYPIVRAIHIVYGCRWKKASDGDGYAEKEGERELYIEEIVSISDTKACECTWSAFRPAGCNLSLSFFSFLMYFDTLIL